MKISKYKPLDKDSALKATFTLTFETKYGNFVINDTKLFAKGNNRWISLPQKQYEAEGEKRYFPYNTFEDSQDTKAFQAKVLEALDAFIQAGDISKPIAKVQDTQSTMPF